MIARHVVIESSLCSMTVCTYRGVRYVPHRPLSADMVLRYERRIHLDRQLEAAHHLERMYRGIRY